MLQHAGLHKQPHAGSAHGGGTASMQLRLTFDLGSIRLWLSHEQSCCLPIEGVCGVGV